MRIIFVFLALIAMMFFDIGNFKISNFDAVIILLLFFYFFFKKFNEKLCLETDKIKECILQMHSEISRVNNDILMKKEWNVCKLNMSQYQQELMESEKELSQCKEALSQVNNEQVCLQNEKNKKKLVDKNGKNKLIDLLLASTPISHRILMAAWNDLNFESQCDLLLNYSSIKGTRLKSNGDEIADIALKSPYPLVRYLASKELGIKYTHEKIVRDDSHPLVSASNMVSGCHYFSRVCDDINVFLSMTKEERIEQLSHCTSSGGKFFELMSAVKSEVDKDRFDDSHVLEMLLAYLTNPYVKRDVERDYYSYGPDMGLNWYADGKERESLWRLLLLFPKEGGLANLLPIIPDGESITGLKEVVNELISCNSLETINNIFRRQDIKESELRNTLSNELMRAIRKEELNKFSEIDQSDATTLLCSLRIENNSWEEVYEEISGYFPDSD